MTLTLFTSLDDFIPYVFFFKNEYSLFVLDTMDKVKTGEETPTLLNLDSKSADQPVDAHCLISTSLNRFLQR